MTDPRPLVYKHIDIERIYQDSLSTQHQGAPTIEGELLMLQEYINQARTAWTGNFDNNREEPARHMIRKIAGIAIRCLENHGCPERVMNIQCMRCCAKYDITNYTFVLCEGCKGYMCNNCICVIDSGSVNEEKWTVIHKVKCADPGCSNIISFSEPYDGNWRS